VTKKRVAKKRVGKKREYLSEDQKDVLRNYLRDVTRTHAFISGETGVPVYKIKYYAGIWKLPRQKRKLPRR
jgi:hypothetical protein